MRALGNRDINVQPTRNRRANVDDAQMKRKQDEPVDYATIPGRKHPGTLYERTASAQIDIDFPKFYKADVQNEYARNGRFYAPTYIKLYDSLIRNTTIQGVRRVCKPRQVTKARTDLPSDPVFEAELKWVKAWKAGYDATRADRKRRKSEVLGLPLYVPEQEDPVVELVGEQSMKIECGCCFDDSCSFMTMIQCADGHLFCRDCVCAQAGEAVGKRQPDITCMDTSGCKLAFPSAELQKCLKEPTFNLWQKIVQAEDIAAANLAGLEHCPACDFAMIFEIGVEAAPLLHCLKSDCRLVSCRRCKKKDHTGRPCEDTEDAKLKAEHAVEEAMTEALMRKCPGCQTPFVKELGCNKIVCQNLWCRKISCYLCRQIITLAQPYEHFERDPHVLQGVKCKLWDGNGQADAVERRHAIEVQEAERQARQLLTQAAQGVAVAVR